MGFDEVMEHSQRKSPPKTVKRGSKDKAAELDSRIDRLLNPQDFEDGVIPGWDTVGSAPEGQLTIEDLVSLKPFKMEDLTETIAFRAPSKLLRSAQRIKERAGGTYDVLSDLHRDIYILGLIFMSERYEDILGAEIIIERAKNRALMVKEIQTQVDELGKSLLSESEEDRRADYSAFMEHIQKKPIKVQEHYVRSMEMNPLLTELRRRMVEIAKREESQSDQ